MEHLEPEGEGGQDKLGESGKRKRMQGLWSKMTGFMGSFLPGNAAEAPNKMGDLVTSLVNLRTNLVNTIAKGKDASEIIERYIELNCSLLDKYAVLQVTELLSWNNQSLEGLNHITSGLSVIVKYAQHLIKNSEQRREQWRIIRFSNPMVEKKIKPMKGFETVLRQLGYSQHTSLGLSYPNGMEPNFMLIVNLIADMMAFRKEIKEYLNGKHPHPEHLQQFIPQSTQQEVQAARLRGLKCEDEDLSDTSASHISVISPAATPEDHPVTVSSKEQSHLDSCQTPETVQVQTECNNNSVAAVTQSKVQLPADKIIDAAPSTNACVPEACQPSAVENLKQTPENEEQFETAVGPLEAIQDLVVRPDEMISTEGESGSGANISRIACTICGDDADLYCEDCMNKPLCVSCNANWHRHPQRQGHNKKDISALAYLPPVTVNPVNIDGAYGISTQTNTNLVKQVPKAQPKHAHEKEAQIKNAAIDHKSPNVEQPSRFDDRGMNMSQEGFCLPNQIRDEQKSGQSHALWSPDYQYSQNMNSPPLHYHQSAPNQQPLLATNFDHHSSVLYTGQVAYNQARLVYPGHNLTYPHSQMGSSYQQLKSGVETSPKEAHNNPGFISSYHPEAGPQQHLFPYLQQQHINPQEWQFQNNSVRYHIPWNPYSQDLSVPQPRRERHPASCDFNEGMSKSMFQHANPGPIYCHSDQNFPLDSPQHVLNSTSIRPSNLFHHPETLIQDSVGAHMHAQDIQNTSVGLALHPTSLNIHPMYMPKNYCVHQNSQSLYVQPMNSSFYGHQRFPEPKVQASKQKSSLSVHPNPYLEHVKQVADFKEKSEKCDEFILKLMKEIKNIEQTVNQAMEKDVDYCDTEQFRAFNKDKALKMQQKKGLEEYRQQLEDETILMKMNLDEQVSQEIHYPPDIDLTVLRDNKKPPDPAVNFERDPPASSRIGNAAVPNHPLKTSNINNSATTQSPLHSQSTKKPEERSHRKPASSSLVSLASPSAASANQASSDFSSKEQKMRVPVEVSDRKNESSHQCPPPIPARLPQREDILNRTFPPPRTMVMPNVRNWLCQHCTFINQASSHICAMCDKTSDNPQLVSLSESEPVSDDRVADVSEDSLLTSDKFLDMLDELKKNSYQRIYSQDENDESSEGKGGPFKVDKENTIGSRICDSQEQVILEKKKAQKEFMLKQQSSKQNAPSVVRSKSLSPVPAHKLGQKQSFSSVKSEKETGDLSPMQMSEYYTPPSTASPSPPSPQQGAIEKKAKYKPASGQNEGSSEGRIFLSGCDSKLEHAIARFNEISMIEAMQMQGAEFLKLIKMADMEGFDVEALEIAQSFSMNQDIGPIDWLKKNWEKNVTMVVNMATARGNKQQQNSVGELSKEEAEFAYISCHGNMKDAAKLCVNRRTELYEQLSQSGEYPREEILQAMLRCCGNREAAERMLIEAKVQPFIENIWTQKDMEPRNGLSLGFAGPLPEMCHSFSTSIISHGDFQKQIKDKTINRDRRIRMIFVEGKLKSWGRAELVIKILDNDLPDPDISLEDVIEAVRNCQDRNSALAYLQQECQLCYYNFPMSKIRNLNICQCKMCEGCLTANFEHVLREKYVRHWTCPICSLPDMNDVDVASEYLQFLIMLLQPLVDRDFQNLFETKVRDWHLQKDPSFRWCAHCAEGFLADNQRGQLRMTCPHCQKKTCFSCLRQWEPQHENLTCEDFHQWKIDNDPTNQSVGLAKHLDENGINCPNCKMRFALAKGGCMHFKCPQCAYEFCSGCNEPFHHKNICTKYKVCKSLGLHCHCPRDCFSYLRDNTVKELQQLLQMSNVAFNVKPPEDQTDPEHCPVMEQKEFDMGKRDEKCGKDVEIGHAGLCDIHYKEYLVCIINKNHLDPVFVMSVEDMSKLLQRYDMQAPVQDPKQTEADYVAHLRKLIQDKLPLRR